MVLCLLTGNILLIAVVISHPLYKQATLDRMLADEFKNYITENGTNPGVIKTSLTRTKDNTGDFNEFRSYMHDEDILGIPVYADVEYLHEAAMKADYPMKRDNKSTLTLQVSMISGLEEHAKVVSGEMYSDEKKDGIYEAVVSETAFVSLNLLVGDVLTVNNLTDESGEAVKIKVTGVFTCDDITDPYWVMSPSEFKNDIFISEKVFEELHVSINEKMTLLGRWYIVFDTDKMHSADVDTLVSSTENIKNEAKKYGGRVAESDYMTVIEQFSKKGSSVTGSLLILQIPVIVLLCAFLLMISGQLLSMEQTEISLMRSRGASGKQIFFLYFVQALIISSVSFAAAIPAGILICKLLGSADAFLSFSGRRQLDVYPNAEMWIYALLALCTTVIMQVLPVIRKSRVSIVSAKRDKQRSIKKWWQKIYLDVAMLGVSIYGFYSFNSRKEELELRVLEGETLDPLLYFSSSLFILGAGLVFLRFWPHIVKFVYRLGRKKWNPQMYASLLQVTRNSGRQIFMMEFLVLTVALGIFNATVARTILYNAMQNESHLLGTDLVLEQKWKSNIVDYNYGTATELIYQEADSNAFARIPGVKAMTKVLYGKAERGSMIAGGTSGKQNKQASIYYMGVITDEFGKMTQDFGGNPYSLREYLNVLSTDPQAVIVSENYKTKLDMKLGDTISFVYMDSQASNWKKEFKGRIYGFFSEFPSYSPKTTTVRDDGTVMETENYMIVGNLAGMQSQLEVTPYELWFDLEDGGESGVRKYISENDITLNKYDSLSDNLENIYMDPLFQGTNGILTLSFIIILVLCSAGFLIYWVLSIKERELLFGVLRAMGMSKKNIFSMLVMEQVFSTLLSLVAGSGIGILASHMFVPMLQMTYTAGNNVLSTPLMTWTSDMIRLFAVIITVIAACLVILARLIYRSKITSALKLGED